VAQLAAGRTVGIYTVIRDLSYGGMGQAYLAHDADGRQVVLKFPHISIVGDPALYDRYRRELEIGRTLRHPHIQHVLDSGEYEGHPYMVTEYVEGETLRAYLSEHAPLPIPVALHLLDQLCQAVAYCHEHGVVHRDLKPENILVTPTGDVSIIDFGIALLRGARRITWAGLTAAVGTPDYMAPEQVQGKRGDVRTDIYSLGAIGYELLTQQPPYSGDNPLAVMGQHLYGTLRPVAEVNPEVPAGLAQTIERALRRQPEERYQTVEEFRQALLHYEELAPTTSYVPERRRLLASHPRVRRTLHYALVIAAILAGLVLIGVLAQLAHGTH
jgi:eukaryotic-like serine/threonine-protein kinase